MIGVYFETWHCPWTAKVETCELAKVEADIVFLAFANPNSSYKKSRGTWVGTGVDFSIDFQVIRQTIKVLQQKGTQVFLSIGGATYSFNGYNKNVIDLAYDLEVDGVDLDFEPISPVNSQDEFIDIIKKTKSWWTKKISIAGFASGCLPPLDGDSYRGCMLKVLEKVGDQIDFINLMNYDAGKGWDYKAAYLSYKSHYDGPIYFGLEVGPQGWGDAYLTLEDVKKASEYVATTDGWFIWAYFKDGKPNAKEVMSYIKSSTSTPKPTPIPGPQYPTFNCPNCSQLLMIQKK